MPDIYNQQNRRQLKANPLTWVFQTSSQGAGTLTSTIFEEQRWKPLMAHCKSAGTL